MDVRAAVVRPVARWWLWLRHQVLGRRHRRLVLEHVAGLPLVVLPEVFNPGLFRTSPFLVEVLARAYPGQAGAGRRALDMGTGSGVGALCAARLGFQAVGVDVSPEAVRCARINVLLNRMEASVEIRQGDLFAPVAGECFDVVLFNPPFWRGAPRDWHDHAWRSADVPERFAAGLPAHLAPGGQALIVLSTDSEWAAMLRALEANGLRVTALARRDLGNEVLTVYSASHAE